MTISVKSVRKRPVYSRHTVLSNIIFVTVLLFAIFMTGFVCGYNKHPAQEQPHNVPVEQPHTVSPQMEYISNIPEPTELFLDTSPVLAELFYDTYPPEAPPYTEQDIIMLCKMVYGEARGCSAAEQALCVWTVLNRLDDGRFGSTIEYILTAKNQFFGYKQHFPVTDGIRAVVERVLEAWAAGESAPVLPPYAIRNDYLYFSGGHKDTQGKLHNYFK